MNPDKSVNSLSRKALAKNSLIKLAGFGLPLLVGRVTIPLIVRGFGIERFGVQLWPSSTYRNQGYQCLIAL